MFKRLAAMAFCLAAISAAQTNQHVVNVVPTAAGEPGGATAGSIRFLNKQNTFHVDLAAPDSGMSGNVRFSLPPVDGTSSQCLTTDGALHLSFNNCPAGLTPPITFTGSTAGGVAILALNQSGTGPGLAIVDTNTAGARAAFMTSVTTSGGIHTLGLKDSSALNAPGIDFFDSTGGQIGIIAVDTSNVALDVSGASINHILTVAQSGNVGVRRTSPSFTLDVNGSFGANGAITLSNFGAGLAHLSSGGVLSSSGIVPADINSGTGASLSTALRGDGTWSNAFAGTWDAAGGFKVNGNFIVDVSRNAAFASLGISGAVTLSSLSSGVVHSTAGLLSSSGVVPADISSGTGASAATALRGDGQWASAFSGTWDAAGGYGVNGVTIVDASRNATFVAVSAVGSTSGSTGLLVANQSGTGPGLRVTSTNATGDRAAFLTAVTTSGGIHTLALQDSSALNAPGIDFFNSSGTQIGILAVDTSNVAMDISGASINHIFTVAQSGKVGVNKAVPVATLDVVGSFAVSGSTALAGVTATGISISGAAVATQSYVTSQGYVTSSGVTSVATAGPISGGTITTTGTISCPTCVRSSGSNGFVSGSSQFSSGTKTVSTGLSSVNICTANQITGGAANEYVAMGSPAGGSAVFNSSNASSSAFFTYICTGTP